MEHSENLHIVQLTLIRNLQPKEAVDWIKQNYPDAHIGRTHYSELKAELKRTAPQRNFKAGQELHQTITEVRDTINDLQKKSFENLERAITDEDHKSAQFIINSIRDLQIWKLNIAENTKGVIEIHAQPKHSITDTAKDQSTTLTTQQ